MAITKLAGFCAAAAVKDLDSAHEDFDLAGASMRRDAAQAIQNEIGATQDYTSAALTGAVARNIQRFYIVFDQCRIVGRVPSRESRGYPV
jgi:hypothetical protein